MYEILNNSSSTNVKVIIPVSGFDTFTVELVISTSIRPLNIWDLNLYFCISSAHRAQSIKDTPMDGCVVDTDDELSHYYPSKYMYVIELFTGGRNQTDENNVSESTHWKELPGQRSWWNWSPGKIRYLKFKDLKNTSKPTRH